jgi:hypothetical protein
MIAAPRCKRQMIGGRVGDTVQMMHERRRISIFATNMSLVAGSVQWVGSDCGLLPVAWEFWRRQKKHGVEMISEQRALGSPTSRGTSSTYYS